MYKNIVVSSAGFVDASSTIHSDYSLRLIFGNEVGPESGLKYSVTDSNGEVSYWCLRLEPITQCDSTGSCECGMVPPVNNTADPNFWKSDDQDGVL